MRNALILHGAGNNSLGNWIPWLRVELEKNGYKVWSPDLPDAEKPEGKKWLEVIYSNENWEFNEDSLVIGHSAGATFILSLLEELDEGIRVKKAVLVAGFADRGSKSEYFQYKEGLLKDGFNWEKIKRSCGKFVFVHSDNDPYQCGRENGEIFQKHLGGKLVVILGGGHFNLETSLKFKQFPELLRLI